MSARCLGVRVEAFRLRNKKCLEPLLLLCFISLHPNTDTDIISVNYTCVMLVICRAYLAVTSDPCMSASHYRCMGSILGEHIKGL